MNDLKFLKKGIKKDGKYYPVHYSQGDLLNYPKGTITIYAKSILKGLPNIGNPIDNQTDIITDYFEKDKIGIHSLKK
jgi:hypothetical protein